MSVTTTFDEKIELAKKSITIAYESLLECVKEDTWGYSDMKQEYIDSVVEVAAELIKLKRRL